MLFRVQSTAGLANILILLESKLLARESIFQLKALVEENISADLKAAKLGAIMHDGWTENRMHFLGLLATYMK